MLFFQIVTICPLSLPSRSSRYPRLHIRDEKMNMILFLSFFLVYDVKLWRCFVIKKKEIYIWIVEATDSIFSEWMRKLSWLWSFSIKTAHSVSTITFYIHKSICWHGNYLDQSTCFSQMPFIPLMPCPFTGPKMFCAGTHFLCRIKNLFTYCASHKHFVPDKKMICIQ